jgi:hypothetical protein
MAIFNDVLAWKLKYISEIKPLWKAEKAAATAAGDLERIPVTFEHSRRGGRSCCILVA